jgi:hypothetical protein
MRSPLWLALVVLAGCAKAKAVPRAEGGYLLYATTANLEQALTRFERTAHDRCGDRYKLTPPVVVGQGYSGGPYGPVSTLTYQCELTCEPGR